MSIASRRIKSQKSEMYSATASPFTVFRLSDTIVLNLEIDFSSTVKLRFESQPQCQSIDLADWKIRRFDKFDFKGEFAELLKMATFDPGYGNGKTYTSTTFFIRPRIDCASSTVFT